jgi:hypothetical protein
VRKVGSDGVITSIAGVGKKGVGTDGPATASKLGYTARVVVDGDWLLIADQSSAEIWRLRLR